MTVTTAVFRRPDSLDLRIIHLLARDPRVPFQEIADQFGVCRTTVRLRVRRLLKTGFLAFTVLTHPCTAGTPVSAELRIETSRPEEEVAAVLGARPHLRTGRAGEAVTVSAWCRDDEDLIALADQLRAWPHIYSVEVFRAVHLLHDRLPAPAQPGLPLDKSDHLLLDVLAREPRAPYTWLGAKTGLSPSAARQRLLRLRQAGLVHLKTDLHLPGLEVQACRVEMTLHAPALTAAHHLKHLPGLTYLAVGHGRYHVLADLATTPDRQHDLDQQIRAVPGIENLRVWRRTPPLHDALALLPLLPLDDVT